MSQPGGQPSRDFSIGTALIFVGVLILVVKIMSFWMVKKALSLLWPLVLIGIGITMYRNNRNSRTDK